MNFNEVNGFNNFVKGIIGESKFNKISQGRDTDFNVSDEESELVAIFSRLSDNDSYNLLVRLLLLYGSSYDYNESEYNSLWNTLIGSNYIPYNIFLSIFRDNNSSSYIKKKSEIVLEDFREIINCKDKNEDSNDEDNALRSLTMDSDIVVSSICSNILAQQKGYSDSPKENDKDKFNSVIDVLKNNNTENVSNIIRALKNKNNIQWNKAIAKLEKTNIPSKKELIKEITNARYSKNTNKNLDKIIKKLKRINLLLKNERNVINGRLNICKGSNKVLYGMKEMFAGICSIRDGFDKAHWLNRNNDINPLKYKADAIFSFNVSAIKIFN